jgi:hypothetical protein
VTPAQPEATLDEHVEALGGSLEVHSEYGAGTTMVAEISLD